MNTYEQEIEAIGAEPVDVQAPDIDRLTEKLRAKFVALKFQVADLWRQYSLSPEQRASTVMSYGFVEHPKIPRGARWMRDVTYKALFGMLEKQHGWQDEGTKKLVVSSVNPRHFTRIKDSVLDPMYRALGILGPANSCSNPTREGIYQVGWESRINLLPKEREDIEVMVISANVSDRRYYNLELFSSLGRTAGIRSTRNLIEYDLTPGGQILPVGLLALHHLAATRDLLARKLAEESAKADDLERRIDGVGE